jgi:short-subunit dehydrogenase
MRGDATAGTDRALALITGASSGIGAEFARALAARHYDLVLVARRLNRLQQLAEELSRRHGICAEALPADLACAADVDKIVQHIASSLRFQLLVNNAGFGLPGNFHEIGCEAQLRMYQVHVIATMRLCHAALPRLIGINEGGIINVASTAGFARMPGHASYGSTKAWMIAFTECLHLELKSARSKVRVQALCPGYTYTEFHEVLGHDQRKIMPVKAFWLTPEFVVAKSLRAFGRNQWLVVPGRQYWLLTTFLEKAPRALVHPLVAKFAQRHSRAAGPPGNLPGKAH